MIHEQRNKRATKPQNESTRVYVLPVTSAMLLVLLIGSSFLLSLAYWQWQRYQYKLALVSSAKQLQQAPAVALDQVSNWREFQKVIVTGRFLMDKQFWLQHKTYHGQAGVDIITPLQLTNGNILLVDRGFVERSKKANFLVLPNNEVTLQGNLHKPAMPFMLGKNILLPIHWPLLIQRIDIKQIATILHQPVLPIVLRLTVSPYQLTQNWPVTTVIPQRHLAYCIQWILIAIGFMVVVLLKGAQL